MMKRAQGNVVWGAIGVMAYIGVFVGLLYFAITQARTLEPVELLGLLAALTCLIVVFVFCVLPLAIHQSEKEADGVRGNLMTTPERDPDFPRDKPRRLKALNGGKRP